MDGLQGYGLAELEILSFIDLAHAAAGDEAEHAVALRYEISRLKRLCGVDRPVGEPRCRASGVRSSFGRGRYLRAGRWVGATRGSRKTGGSFRCFTCGTCGCGGTPAGPLRIPSTASRADDCCRGCECGLGRDRDWCAAATTVELHGVGARTARKRNACRAPPAILGLLRREARILARNGQVRVADWQARWRWRAPGLRAGRSTLRWSPSCARGCRGE